MNEGLQAFAENEGNTSNGKLSSVNGKQATEHDETEVEQAELTSPKDLSPKQSFGNMVREIVLTVVEPTTKVVLPIKKSKPRYAHELRRGGMHQEDWPQATKLHNESHSTGLPKSPSLLKS
jgi:hypothetical protein